MTTPEYTPWVNPEHVGAFSIPFTNLPNTVSPNETGYYAQRLDFRDEVVDKMDRFRYFSKTTLGGVVTVLLHGESQHLTAGLIEPVPGHGVTITNPEAIMDENSIGKSNVRLALSDLVKGVINPIDSNRSAAKARATISKLY